MAPLAPRLGFYHQAYPHHSVMEDASDDGDDEDEEQSYEQQQQQAMYYQQQRHHHQQQQQQQQQQHFGSPGTIQQANAQPDGQEGIEDDEIYSDDESSAASIPDENIDFSLTYALYVPMLDAVISAR